MIIARNSTSTTRLTPSRVAEHLRSDFPATLSSIYSIMRHPRSLARPLASWRPPSKELPPLPGGTNLRMTLTRHRVGPHVRSVVYASGETRSPAYLITARISSPEGLTVPAAIAEGWVRALVSDRDTSSVHELTAESAPTYCWLVDSHFIPVKSPASLFSDHSEAA